MNFPLRTALASFHRFVRLCFHFSFASMYFLTSLLISSWKTNDEIKGFSILHSENKDHGIWSHCFMANRWRNSGNSGRFFLGGGSKITADGIKRCLLLGRKVMTNLDSILKSRDITLSTKVRLVKAMVFPVVTYELDYKET